MNHSKYKFKELLINFGTCMGALLSLFFIAEMAVRTFVDERRYQFFDVTDSWEPDDTLGWKIKPNYTGENHLFGKMVRFATNADGLRPETASPEKKLGVERVLLLGNSTVASRTVGENETLHFYLDSLLNLGDKRFEVVNAAVDGYSTAQAFLQLRKLIKKYRPDYVGYGFCNNDLFGNFKGKDASGYKPYFELVNGAYDLMPPKINANARVQGCNFFGERMLLGSALIGFLRPAKHRLRVSWHKHLKQVEGIDPDIFVEREKYVKEFNLFRHLISEMNKLCKENNASFFFYAHPSLKTVWAPFRELHKITFPPTHCEDALGEIAQEDGIQFLKMVDYFLLNQDKGPFHLLPLDRHCNGNGYRVQAEIIAKEINQ